MLSIIQETVETRAEDNLEEMPTDHTSDAGEDFALLLAWLDPDPELAGEKYEQVRQNLLDYFRRRGALDAPSLTDEVFARVTKKIRFVAPGFVGNPAHYFLGVARHVLSEWRRQPEMTELPEHLSVLTDETAGERKELMLQGLEHCWTLLSPQKQEILLHYYLGMPTLKLSDSREQLARNLGLSLNTLRVTAHRMKNRLKRCIEKSIKRKQIETVSPILHH
jgi:RNA polymerase sigma factor (sigma-70 family)